MSFVPENDLERLLVDATSKTELRSPFTCALLDGDIFVLGETGDGDAMRFSVAERDGHNYILFFTSLTRLKAFIKGEESYLQMRGRDLFAKTPGAYYILNPGAQYGKEFLPDEVASLLSPEPASRATESTPILISQPEDQPFVLMEALTALFADRDSVEAAHLAQIAGLEGMEPHPLLGVDAGGDWDKLSAEIGRVIADRHLGKPVDVVRIERGTDGTLSAGLLKYPPFYRRQAALP
jgi:hypothetical protein